MEDNKWCPGTNCQHRLSCWRYITHNLHQKMGSQGCVFPEEVKQNGSCKLYWHTKKGRPVAKPDRIKAHTLEGWRHIRLAMQNDKDPRSQPQVPPGGKKTGNQQG